MFSKSLANIAFSVATLQSLYEKYIKKVSKRHPDDKAYEETQRNKVLDYVYTYYFEVAKGDYYFYDVTTDEFVYKTQRDFINEVANKLDTKKFNIWFSKNPNIYKLTSNIHKPRIYEEGGQHYINECKGFLHKSYLPFDKYTDEIKANVKLMLDMIKEISCNNNEELFKAYVKYLSQLCKGQKTEVIIYKKAIEGIGKSTESDFLMNHVLGNDICLLSGTEPLTTNFNRAFLGKLLIVFEELPTFGIREWEAVSSKLKTLTTEKTATYRDLFKSPFQAENISNFMINTNVESIKNSDGRRYIILPLNDSRKGDFEYFENIRTKCFNNEVGEAFFSYMLEVDTKGFYAQKNFPETENKRLAHANLLDPVEKFIKSQYLLKNRGIEKTRTTELYKHYIDFCSSIVHKPLTNVLFYAKLKSLLKFESKKINGYQYYCVTLDELKALAEKNKWLCEFDEVETEAESDDTFIDEEEESPLDYGVKPSVNYEVLYHEAMKKIAFLENEVKNLKSEISKN